MREQMTGHTWNPRSGVRPAVLAAVAIAGRLPRSVRRIEQTCWVLDYEFAAFGRCRVRAATEPWFPRAARTAHLYPAGTPYWEDTRGQTGCRDSAWIQFAWSGADGPVRLVDPRLGFARCLDPDGRLGDVIRRTVAVGQQRGESGFWKAQALLCDALDLLAAARPAEHGTRAIGGGVPGARDRSLPDAVDACLRELMGSRVTLTQLARRLNVSVSLLAHRYRALTGTTPMAALARLRVNHAKALLQRGYPLKAIADQLGFVDAFHLSRTFKRQEGRSPRLWRADAGAPRGAPPASS